MAIGVLEKTCGRLCAGVQNEENLWKSLRLAGPGEGGSMGKVFAVTRMRGPKWRAGMVMGAE